MKTLLLGLAMVVCGINVNAQPYPITSADQLQKLVVQPDLAQIKMLIFNDEYVLTDRFVYFAVIQGLAKDGIPTSIANTVATEGQADKLLTKCEVCNIALKAFQDYATYGTAYSGKKNLYPNLASSNAQTRHSALETVIDKYTSAFSTLLELSTLEQERLQSTLGNMRKKG